MALSESTEKAFFSSKGRGCMIYLTTVTIVFFYFLSTFGKGNLTTNVMFSGQCFAIIAILFTHSLIHSGCKIYFFWRLHDFFCWRGCMIFRERLQDFLGESLYDFSSGEVACFFWWTYIYIFDPELYGYSRTPIQGSHGPKG